MIFIAAIISTVTFLVGMTAGFFITMHRENAQVTELYRTHSRELRYQHFDSYHMGWLAGRTSFHDSFEDLMNTTTKTIERIPAEH